MLDFIVLPETLSWGMFIVLIVLSCFTSMLTASLGIGGGTVLLAVMAQVLPVKAIIPVHGVVQLGSNFGRAMVMLPNTRWDLFAWFVIGSILGAVIGGQIVVSLPVDLLRGLLGGFILFSVWGSALLKRSIDSRFTNSKSLTIGGLLSTVLTMFVGATGPFVIAILKPFKLAPKILVATNAVCLVVQHLLKIVVFGFLGFVFTPYISLIVLMMISGFVGTIIGRNILLNLNQKAFETGLNIILSLLGLRLLYSAIA